MTNSSPENDPSQEAGAFFGELIKHDGETITPALAGELAMKLVVIAHDQEATTPQTAEEALNNIALADKAVSDANAKLENTVYVARKRFNISFAAIGGVFGVTRQAAQERWADKIKNRDAE
jgi:hypothetical protein